MSVRNNGVHDFLEQSPGFFISGNKSTGLDHGVTLVIDTSLNAVSNVNTEFSLSILKLSVKRRIFLEDVSQKVVVVLQVGELSG